MSTRITSPFGFASTAREVVAGQDLSGLVAVVTGGASGIGVETVRALAEAGAQVTIAARNGAAADAVAQQINATLAAGAPGRVHTAALDLGSLASVRGFIAAWGTRPLHRLIHNAGVMACPPGRTAEGFELQFGTNHLGHFVLGCGLVPALQAGAAARGQASRLVSLSSIGHRRSGIRWDDPNFHNGPYDKWEAYGQSKTANSLFAVGFEQRFGARGIHANAVMPGGIMTPLQRHMTLDEQRAMGWIDEAGRVRDGFKTTEQGAATSVWAAVGPELEGVGGLYLEDCAQALPWQRENPWVGVMPHALDAEAATRLWALSEALTGA